jgi:hypothetical protein
MQVLRIEGLRQGKDTEALRFFFGRYCGRFTEKMNVEHRTSNIDVEWEKMKYQK